MIYLATITVRTKDSVHETESFVYGIDQRQAVHNALMAMSLIPWDQAESIVISIRQAPKP